MQRIKEGQKDSNMVAPLPEPQVNPALQAFRQSLGMVNGNDNQVGLGGFAGGNGS